jgi:vacuolar-type H+-ATPase subunit I/STV1
MATDLREVLAKYGLNEDAMAEIEEAATPDTFRSQLAELGAKAKRADELESRLSSIESAPKRKEALKRVGVDYDAQPKYGRKTLDAIPADRLDDLDFVANYVKEEGFEATLAPEQQTGERSGAEQIVDFTSNAGTGAPVRTGQQAADEAFYADLDRVPDGDKEAIREVLMKHGRLEAPAEATT